MVSNDLAEIGAPFAWKPQPKQSGQFSMCAGLQVSQSLGGSCGIIPVACIPSHGSGRRRRPYRGQVLLVREPLTRIPSFGFAHSSGVIAGFTFASVSMPPNLRLPPSGCHSFVVFKYVQVPDVWFRVLAFR